MGKRRAKGEGSIYQRDDGLWVGTIDLGYQNGKRRRLTLYGKTQRDVSDKLLIARRDRQLGMLPEPSKQTLGQFLEHWLENVAKHAVRPRTYEFYADKARLYIIPHIGKVRLTKLTPQHLQTLYTDLLEQSLSARTVRHVHSIIHNALGQALRWGLVPRNISSVVSPPRSGRPDMAVLSFPQTRTFLEAARGDKLEALYVLALASGARQAELLGLRWQDVDLEGGAVHIKMALQRLRGAEGWAFTEPKSAKSRRSISLPDIAVEALRRHRVSQLQEHLLAGPEWQDHDLVFCTERGTPLSPQNLMRRSFKPLLARAGLLDMRFHDLRHTSATLLLALGEHPKIVQERLGHSQISLTMDTYSHILPDMQREAARHLDQALKT